MSKLSTVKFRLHNAQQFKEAFNEASPTNLYVFIGRISPWDDENNPPTPVDTVEETEYAHWRSIIAMKKIKTSDVSFAVPRYDWVSGTVYAEYDSSDNNLYNKKFYVLNSADNVYKCLFNNYDSPSTVEPSGTSTDQFTTSDGYIWKFMYAITSSDRLKFVTSNFIPVQTLSADDSSAQWAVQVAASNGSIDVVEVNNGGSNYIVNKGDIQSITNSSIFQLESTANSTDDVFVGSSFYVSSGLGSGQIDEIVNYNGTNKTVRLRNGLSITPNTSSTYHVGPRIKFTGDGINASAYANVASNTSIERVNVINSGQDYSRVNVVAVSNTGSGASLQGMISPKGGHGSDAVSELGGFNVIMNSRLDGTESGTFPANNDFRTLGILKNPELANGQLANSDVYDLTTRLDLKNVVGTFEKDEFVEGSSSGADGRIVRFANSNASGTQGRLYLTTVSDGPFINTEGIVANSSGTTATIDGLVQQSIIRRIGDVVYIEYRSPVQRSENQIEDIKVLASF